jgi:hypothetical protein
MRKAIVCLFLIASLPALAAEKFSLSLFHFNIQYVAGGLKGFPDGKSTDPAFDLDDAQVQDMIITESFEPVLDLFLAHPTWSVTLEMQAYMAEVIAQRHPAVLAKMRTLQQGGQLELVSFHYSDELFLAYPRHDLEISHRLLEKTFADLGLDVSGVVFCQEGQFGEGMAAFGKARGRRILLLPKNLFRYQHQDLFESAAPLYTLDDVDVVMVGRGFADEKVEVSWSFFDDGELLATGGMAPYVPSAFKRNQEALSEYENKLQQAEAAGFRIAKVADFVAWARANGIPPQPLVPILDGTWQPASTDSMHRWMGASGLLDAAYQSERDNQVLTANVIARHWLLGAEVLVTEAEKKKLIETGSRQNALLECWKYALLGRVSDATGINPFINEVNYGLEHARQAQECADKIIDELAPRLGGPFLLVDTGSGTVTVADDRPSAWLEPAEAPSELSGLKIEAPGRKVISEWRRAGNGALRLEVLADAAGANERLLSVTFPLQLDGFYLSGGLREEKLFFHSFSEFDLQQGRITVPLSNGLVGIGPDLWLIKQTDSVHLGATIVPAEKTITFRDETQPADEKARWIFWVWQGKGEDALKLAQVLNITPQLVVQTGTGSQGCACSIESAGTKGSLLSFLVLLFACRIIRLKQLPRQRGGGLGDLRGGAWP